eukprot:TRINITY_DN219_c0_g5_i2.p1 TRINITY_DN219_c0_g5~~TRINITY_DN219_c0_g5_i2.p1  ORF type:complete len:448 (+),score=160.39 TRINITY_DN219_c0_g5_i2:133-1476(+)
MPSGTDVCIAEGRFLIKRKLGAGSFGDVYQGLDQQTQEFVAIKLEHKKQRYPQLRNEARVLRTLNMMHKHPCGFAKLFWCGDEGDYTALVMTFLGPSVQTLHEYCGRKFTLKTTVMLAIQMMRRIEHLHSVFFIHRDIKPENFVLGRGNRGHHVYLIDYGLSKRYWNVTSDSHIEYRDGRPLVGTARYCSLATHLGIEQSRRDDLEALGYVWIYFLRGVLPWQGIHGDNVDEKVARIGEKKESVSVESLCRGEHSCWRKFMSYVRTMEYEEQPAYEAMGRLLRQALESDGGQLDWQFDWIVKRREQVLAKRKKAERALRKAERARQRGEKRAADFTGEGEGALFGGMDDASDASTGTTASTGPLPSIPFAAPGTLTREQEDDIRKRDSPGTPGSRNTSSPVQVSPGHRMSQQTSQRRPSAHAKPALAAEHSQVDLVDEILSGNRPAA